MPLRIASLLSRIGLLTGLGFGLALVVADVTAFATSGHPAMATPFHILPVAAIMILTIGGIAGQCTVRILHGQERLAEVQRQIVELVNHRADGLEQGAQVVQLAGRVARRIGED